MVSGVFTQINGVDRNNIARLNSDGTVDTTFNPPCLARNGFLYAWVYAAAIDQDGKVLMGGDFTHVNGLPRNYLVRLNANGSLDSSFNALFDDDAPLAYQRAGAHRGFLHDGQRPDAVRGSPGSTRTGVSTADLIRGI